MTFPLEDSSTPFGVITQATMFSICSLPRDWLEDWEDSWCDAEKGLFVLQSYVLEQHDFRFQKTLKQAAFFYQIPIGEGNFDPRKDFYKGELIPIKDISDEEEAAIAEKTVVGRWGSNDWRGVIHSGSGHCRFI